MSRTLASKREPESYTLLRFIPQVKGSIPSFWRRAASGALTFSPALMRWVSVVISIWPRAILVWICRVWKKAVWPGSQPVGPLGTTTSMGAVVPTLAGAGRTLDSGVLRVLFHEVADAPAHHGVLPHEDFGRAAEGHASLLELHRPDVVDLNDEQLGVRRHALLHVLEVPM